MLPIITFVYEGVWIVGLVVELPTGAWVHRELRVEDRMMVPVPTGELVDTLAPYLRLTGVDPTDPGQPA